MKLRSILLFLLPGLAGAAVAAEDSLVPEAGRMSDAEARLVHARLLAYRPESWADAIAAYERILREDSGNATALAELARLLLRRGELAAAEDRFREALARRPGDPTLLIGLARLHLWSDRPVEAERALAAAAQVRPLSADGRQLRAEVMSRLGRHAEARDAFDALLQGGTPGPALLHAAADARLAAGDLDDARSLFARALAGDPERVGAKRGYALTLAWTRRDAEALPRLEAVLASDPSDYEAGIAYAELLERTAGAESALAEVRRRAGLARNNPAWLVAWAEIEARRGYARRSRALFAEAFAQGKPSLDLRLRRGRSALSWGDVATAEAAFRAVLAERPADDLVRDELGRLLASFNRLPEAEQHYRRWLLEKPDARVAQFGLARVRLQERDFADALVLLENLRAGARPEAEALALQAAALVEAGREPEATAVYRQLAEAPGPRVEALIALGQLARRGGREAEAGAYFAEAQTLAPTLAAARFHAAGPERVREEAFLAGLTAGVKEGADGRGSGGTGTRAAGLVEWARLYAESHDFPRAIRCLQAARADDPEYFPAWLQLAEFLAIAARHDEALSEFRRLGEALPDNRQVMLGEARTLAWARRYDEALAAYARLMALVPADPGPRREAARTAGWAKQRERGAELYTALWAEAAVDRALAAGLRGILDGTAPAGGAAAWREWAMNPVFGDEPFARTARFERERDALRAAVPAGAAAIERLYVDLLPALRLQREFFLENQGKQLAWDRRFSRAESAYRRLLEIQPGNQEAWFDLSQVQAAQGLGERERATLAALTALDAGNTLAAAALRRRGIRSRPVASLEARTWREEGRGDLASLRRAALTGEIAGTWRDQFSLRLAGRAGRERPLGGDGRFAFRGLALEAGGVLNERVSGSAGFTHHAYRDGRIGNVDTGHVQLALNLRDAVRLGAGYEKREEVANRFGLFQGTRSDQGWVGGTAVLSRRFELDGRFTALAYSDANRGTALELRPAYAWSDHPRIFKTILTLAHRDTDHASRFLYAGPRLMDIVHPYWAPQRYGQVALTLEWHHDLAREFFIGSQAHVYDLRVTFGTDTESNAGVTFEGDWRREWVDRWIVHATAYLNLSREWDATGLRLRLSRRF